jgi:hypothetical protein
VSSSRKFIGYPVTGDVGKLLIKVVATNERTKETADEVFSLIISKPSETSPSAASAPSDPAVPNNDREESEHWVKLLEDASYGGKWQKDDGYAPLATGDFSKLRAVYKRGFVACDTPSLRKKQESYKWQICNDEPKNWECKPECHSFELKTLSRFILKQRLWHQLPPECIIPSSPTGDIICSGEFEIFENDRLIPTWKEPSRRVSLGDNSGDIFIDLYGLPRTRWSEWPPCPVTCGSGTQTRRCEKGVCKGPTTQTCNTKPCPYLAVSNPIGNQATEIGATFVFVIPSNAFSQPRLTFAATLSTGAALPSWITFVSSSRKFIGYPVGGDVGKLLIKVVATNEKPESVEEVFSLIISKPSETSPSAAAAAAAPSDPAVPVSIWISLCAALLVAVSCYLGKRCERRKLSVETKIEMEGLVVRPSDEGIVQSHVQPGMHF